MQIIRTIITAVLLGLVMLTGCNTDSTGRRLTDMEKNVCGSYKTYLSTNYTEPDGMSCSLNIHSVETFGTEGIRTQATMSILFCFGGALEFSDITMEYDFLIDGAWRVIDSTLTIEPDTCTFRQKYRRSSAQTVVEKAMVRQLKRYVSQNLRPKLCAYLSDVCRRKNKIMRICENGIVGSMNDETIVLLRNTERLPDWSDMDEGE